MVTATSDDANVGYKSDDTFSALQNGVAAINNLVTLLSSLFPIPSS